MVPVLLLTRPKKAAEAFLNALSDHAKAQVEVIISPLIDIRFCGELPDLTQFGVLIFTSANGVAAFVNAGGMFDRRCVCVGDMTAKAAQDSGLNAVSVDGDANVLVDAILSMHPKQPALHIRGEHTRGDVAARLTASGMPTSQAVLYSQDMMNLNPAAKAALSQDRNVVVPLFSPRTARRLIESVAPSDRMVVLAISAAVAAEIPQGHVGACHVVAAPNRREMVVGVEGLIRNASLA